jgi:hypothetical protein
MRVLEIKEIQNVKDLKDQLTKATTTHLVEHLEQSAVNRKVLLIDNLDVLLSVDRCIASNLTDMLHQKSQLPYIPVVMVGSLACERKLGAAFISKAKLIYVQPASPADIFLFLKSQNTAAPTARLMAIAEGCGGNIANALQQIANGSRAVDRTLTFSDVFSSPSVVEIRSILEDEPWLNPLRFHENVLRELGQRRGRVEQKRLVYRKILEACISWDFLMPSSQPLAIEQIVQVIVAHLHSLPRKKSATDKTLAEFTKIFSHMSLQKKLERSAYFLQ